MRQTIIFILLCSITVTAWEIPTRWRIFAPISIEFQPSVKELLTIPKSFDGCSGKDIIVQDGRLTFDALTVPLKDTHCGWAFAEVQSEENCEIMIGAGADWYLTLYLNGQIILNSMESGNGGPVQADSFINKAWLKKGKNILAVQVSRGSKNAEFVIGNEETIAGLKTALRKNKPAFILNPEAEFDPVKAGWKLIFSDEFNGDTIDWEKWRPKAQCDLPYLTLDGLGNLIVTADRNDGKIQTGEIFSKPNFKYGYFEARVKFTRQPGWWAAFWLYGYSNRNAMLDGVEIDIFEDYFFRPRNKTLKFSPLLDFNFHIYSGSHLHSWKYSALVSERADDYHVLGCKWTPFEISLYMDGKAITAGSTRSPWNQVTFDAINHGTGTTPLHVVINGNIMRASMKNRMNEGTLPEKFVVDYVRVYEYPSGNDPQVTIAEDVPRVDFVASGDKVRIPFFPQINKNTGSPIVHAYLFDNGIMIADIAKAPWEFELPFHKDFFDKTPFMNKSRRSGKHNVFDATPHVFAVYVQDAAGNVGHSEVILRIPAGSKLSAPYQGVAQKLPGKLKLCKYDEGGQGVAYFDCDRGNSSSNKIRPEEDVDVHYNSLGNIRGGEYIHYTVEVEKAGRYRIALPYGTPYNGDHWVQLLVNSRMVGMFKLKRKQYSWNCTEVAVLRNIELPAGYCRLTFVMSGGFNIADPIFQLENAGRGDE